ncbi:hypothetical protein QYE76_015827 [Lolium multiflorum]|uniref:BAG domain-containing protein n=1 Tax=Lolium multiflorum TaxID=4521 RepID=A0AAD8U362_LOLMU|nr:hypothetical protein QYE76_015827 [Lolium multiflorum]
MGHSSRTHYRSKAQTFFSPCRCDSSPPPPSPSPSPIPSPRPEMSRYHHHHEPPPPACCSCGCFCACSALAPCGVGGGYYPAPAQPAPASDQLLHAIAAHLLLNSAPPPPPQPQPHPQQPPLQPPAAHHANLHSSYAYQYNQQQQQGPNTHAYPHPPPPPPQHQQQHQGPQSHAYPQPPPPPPPQQQPYQPDHGQLLLHSLLRRVAALETTLPHSYFPTPPPIPQPHPHPHHRHHRAAAHLEESDDPPSPPPRRARGGRRPPPSERELAARTIQEHFRRFLARRSRTLRQLKELAILRSKAASLRGSLSGSGRGRCKDPVAVSEAAMGLLLHLDGIQGGDPMIREGKRAVSRELSRILEFVDKVLVKDHEEMALDNGEYPEGCHGAPVVNRPSANRKVSFHCNEIQNEADDSSESSSSVEADERKGPNSKSIANGKPGLAAPAPVQMESRRAAGEMR